MNRIQHFLLNQTQQVVVDGVASQHSAVVSGVPQGSVLGPLLFLPYINDLPAYTYKDSTTRLFADACAIYRLINTQRDAQLLQEDFSGSLKWESDCGMQFHWKKCEVISAMLKTKRILSNYKTTN